MSFALVVHDPNQLTERALLVHILERIQLMAADLTGITAQVTTLQAQVVATKASADASQALATRAIAVIEDLAAQIAALQPDAQAIADLAARVGQSVATLQGESAEQEAANAALQAEVDKVTTPAP